MSKRSDPKAEALRELGVLNPRAKAVSDPSFQESRFFDPRDLVQVKYEMVRRVQQDGVPVTAAAAAFGFSRVSFYQVQQLLLSSGLAALLPRKRGPKGGHKLNEEVLSFVDECLAREPRPGVAEVVRLIKGRFGTKVHRRSLERALGQRAKKE